MTSQPATLLLPLEGFENDGGPERTRSISDRHLLEGRFGLTGRKMVDTIGLSLGYDADDDDDDTNDMEDHHNHQEGSPSLVIHNNILPSIGGPNRYRRKLSLQTILEDDVETDASSTTDSDEGSDYEGRIHHSDGEEDRVKVLLCNCLDLVSCSVRTSGRSSSSTQNGSSDQLQTPCTSSSTVFDHILLDALQSSWGNGGLPHHAGGLDPRLRLWTQLFQFAQAERSKKYRIRPYGIISLFFNLGDIRSDLAWAQDAVHRRQHGHPYIAWAEHYKTETSGHVRPYFSCSIIMICTFMMLVAFAKNDWKIESVRVNPLIGVTPKVLLDLGAMQGRRMIEHGEWWRLVTPIFLHAGIVHLLLNVLVIAYFCRIIERNHGTLCTGLLFMLSGMGGNMLSALLQPGYILVGASGGIFGMIGLSVADIILNWRLLFLVLDQRQHNINRRSEAAAERHKKGRWCGWSGFDFPNHIFWIRFGCGFWLCVDLLLNSLVGFTPYVDNFAHMGGLIYGFFISLSSLRRLRLSFCDTEQVGDLQRVDDAGTLVKTDGKCEKLCNRIRILTLRCVGFTIALSLLVISSVLLSRSDGRTSPCLGCRYISCLPFPFWVQNDEDKWWTCDICEGVNAQVYKRVGKTYYSDMEIFCPQGYILNLDVTYERYVTIEEVSTDLLDICKRKCI